MLQIERHFTKEGIHPFDEITWIKRDVKIEKSDGSIVFKQDSVEAPDFWSDNSIQIMASKYFYGKQGTPERETSVKDVFRRVTNTIKDFAISSKYMDKNNASILADELCYLFINQNTELNSPALFNLGVREPVASACYINKVEDNLPSILDIVKMEGMIFKYGAGDGLNLSAIRSSKEFLTGGGKPGGPLQYLKVYDTNASVIMSGGVTRRAAKMNILNVDHPDVKDFIFCKIKEEEKANKLVELGLSHEEALNMVQFQNGNNSIRVTDDFMNAVLNNEDWELIARTTGEVLETLPAKDIFNWICEAAWTCADPGLQFHDTVNKWNTCSHIGTINSSNPCQEFTWFELTSCNLASINIYNYFIDQPIDEAILSFVKTVEFMIIAQEIICENAHYPVESFKEETHKTRPLGLGITNLGGTLMALGIPYCENEGREFGASIYSLLTSTAYRTSSLIAKEFKPFEYYNKDSMIPILKLHEYYSKALNTYPSNMEILLSARETWKDAITLGEVYGYRNAQVSTAAPCGTIGMIMDNSTTSIEPPIALIATKKLSGGGTMILTMPCVEKALIKLNYSKEDISLILNHIKNNHSIIGSIIKKEHYNIFKTALGDNVLTPEEHIKMVSELQPHLSLSISKTINCPNSATIDDIKKIFMLSWKLGLKGTTIYRDGSKSYQPLNVKKEIEEKLAQKEEKKEQLFSLSEVEEMIKKNSSPQRKPLPDVRQSITHKFDIAGHEGYITVGLYEDGTPGELFIKMSKEGSTISGLMDGFSIAISLGLQYSVPLEKLCEKFMFTRFEPSGFTKHPDIRFAKSILDYIFKWMKMTFIDKKVTHVLTVVPQNQLSEPVRGTTTPSNIEHKTIFINDPETKKEGDICPTCGGIMVRQGTCMYCFECGNSTGCS